MGVIRGICSNMARNKRTAGSGRALHFFDDPGNAVIIGYVIKCAKEKLGISPATNCRIVKNNSRFELKVDDPNAPTIGIDKGGQQIRMLVNHTRPAQTFMVTRAESMMVLDGHMTKEKVVMSDHLLEWLPKEDGIAYVEFQNKKWYITKHLTDMLGKLPSKDHIFSRHNSDKKDYKDFAGLHADGLSSINGILFSNLHSTTTQKTLVTLEGIHNVLRVPGHDLTTKAALEPIRSWVLARSEIADVDCGEAKEPAKLDVKGIRSTGNGYVSAQDIIKVLNKVSDHLAARQLQKIKDSIAEHSKEFKFPGRGQRPILVVDADGLHILIRTLPGDATSAEREALITAVFEHLGIKTVATTKSRKQIKDIRVTPDKRASVFDIIEVYTGDTHPRMVWDRLIQGHDKEVVIGRDNFSSDIQVHGGDWLSLDDDCTSFLDKLDNPNLYYQFPGQGQRPTPVLDADGINELLMLLPGKRAAKVRVKFAKIITRYLGGDVSLAREVEQINKLQEQLPLDHPMAIYRTLPSAYKKFRQMRIDNGLPPVPMSDMRGKKGIYLTSVGIEKDRPIFKFGETVVDIDERLTSARTRYEAIQDPTFELGIEPMYFKEMLAGIPKDAETELKKRFRLNGVLMGGRYKIANQGTGNQELVTCNELFGVRDIIKTIDEVCEGIESGVVSAIAVDPEHEYRMKKLDVELADREIRRLELQIRLLELERS